MNNIFEDLEAGIVEKPNFVTPSFTTLTSQFKDANLQRALNSGYQVDDAAKRAAMSVINAVFTQKLLVFVISKRVVEALIKADTNFKKGQKPSLGNKGVYAGMLAFLLRKGFKVEVEGESFRPAILAVDNEDWIKHISKELTQDWKEAQYNACLTYVANIDPNTGVNTRINTRVNTESPSPIDPLTINPQQDDGCDGFVSNLREEKPKLKHKPSLQPKLLTILSEEELLLRESQRYLKPSPKTSLKPTKSTPEYVD